MDLLKFTISLVRGSDRNRTARPRRLRVLPRFPAAMAAILFMAVLVPSRTDAAISQEYQVKAVFLSKFASFVTWPGNVFKGANAPVVIGILGSDPFGSALEEAVRGVVIDGRPLTIRRIQRAEDASGCQILFIGEQDQGRLAQILGAVKNSPVLTVGEADQFTRRGGILNFTLSGGRVKIEINPDEAKRAGLRINSKLLGISTIVK